MCLGIAAVPAMAQRWELGGGVGGGFYTSQNVTSPGGSASAKIASNVAASAWLANNSSGRVGGELRIDYQMGDLQLNSGGTSATFGARSYAVHYDVVWHATSSGSKIRPFLAAGAGVKVYQGTGTEVVFQPLSNIALLTQAQDLTPLASAGAGVKIQISPRVQLRAELHDYLTPFPNKVITPADGSKVGGWLQDFVPMVGISFTSSPGR
ncbi:MAG: outer membrane beta-barrel protein [Bryobacteraceae bacterium]